MTPSLTFDPSSIKIFASALSANVARLAEFAESAEKHGAYGLHLDMMDQHYVPELTLGPLFCKALRASGITMPLDVHLMTEPVDRMIESCVESGASSICFHPEASRHIERDLQRIKSAGCQAGLALNPATCDSTLTHVLHLLDFVLVMSVNPGYGGQTFLPHTLKKIEKLQLILDPLHIPIRLDGGIQTEHIQITHALGVREWVVGSFLQPHLDRSMQNIFSSLSHMHQI